MNKFYTYLTRAMLTAIFFVSSTSFAANPEVVFETNHGNIVVELYPEKAPKTVANFLKYVDSGFYKETLFHRVINNFMIQGGGLNKDMSEKQARAPIVNEASNGLENEPGTIAMARTADPDSATAQFFINLRNNTSLNYQGPEPDLIGYCVFGKVTKGMEVVREIGLTPTINVGAYYDVPKSPIMIYQVQRITKP